MGNKVTKRLTKKDVLTIPNALSLVRLLLVPVILWLYCFCREHYWAVAVIVFSALTDIVDGYIARRFHMVSDLGKFLDPVADKLTQIAMIVCLISEYQLRLVILLALFVIKEVVMLIAGSVVLKKTDTVNSAQWYGKAATVILYAAMLALMLFPGVIPPWGADILIAGCAAVMVFALVRYILFYISFVKKSK